MTRVLSTQVERMKRAAQHPSDVWEGGIFRGPAWITEENQIPYRALLPVWISQETGAVFAGEVLRPEDLDFARALDILAKGVLNSAKPLLRSI